MPAAREQIDALEEAAARTRHVLAALTGAGPDRSLNIHDPTVSVVVQPTLPTSVPAELLGHRPDLVAQRWRVEAASQGIREATAEFYPETSICWPSWGSGQNLGSHESVQRRQPPIRRGAPAFTLPLFDAGKRRAKLAGQDAGYDAAVEQWDNQLMTDALREVVDAPFTSMDSLRSTARRGA